MKKTLALLALVAMIFSTGCGKSDVEDAAKDANAAVEDVKDKVDDAANAATDAVNNAANTVATTAQSLIDDAKTTMDNIANGTADKKIVALDGIVPGINYEVITEKYGEPVTTENEVIAFSNGLDVKVADNVVEEVSTTYDGLYTPADVAVGMVDYSLNDAYGDANSVIMNDDGSVSYKYVSNNRTLEFVTRNGYITEIKCTLNK